MLRMGCGKTVCGQKAPPQAGREACGGARSDGANQIGVFGPLPPAACAGAPPAQSPAVCVTTCGLFPSPLLVISTLFMQKLPLPPAAIVERPGIFIGMFQKFAGIVGLASGRCAIMAFASLIIAAIWRSIS